MSPKSHLQKQPIPSGELLSRPGLKASWLASFLEATTKGQFNSAAEALGISSQALKRNLDLLEKHLGIQLFRYKSRGLKLTPEGKAFLPEAWELLYALRNIYMGSENGSNGSGMLRIGWQGGWLQACLVDFSRQLRGLLTGRQLSLLPYQDGTEIERALIRHRLELALLTEKPDSEALDGHAGPVSEYVIASCPSMQGSWRSLSFALPAWSPDEDVFGWIPPEQIKLEAGSIQDLLDIAISGLCAIYLPSCLLQTQLDSGQLELVCKAPERHSLQPYLCWPKDRIPPDLKQIISAFEAPHD